MNSEIINQLEKSVNENNFLKEPRVYNLGGNLVAKFGTKRSIENEYKFGKFLYGKKLNIPKIYGKIDRDEIKAGLSLSKPYEVAIITEKIKGKNLYDFLETEKDEALRKKAIANSKEQIKKVLREGINLMDANLMNLIIDETGEAYIIDFECHNKEMKKDYLIDFYKRFIQSIDYHDKKFYKDEKGGNIK
ncbi:MAG: hypothetical protein Q8Q04_00935 [archaeon]|nr:hypothetical protein [archaeon]